MTARAEQLAIVVGLVIILLAACSLVVAGLRGQIVQEADDHHHGPDHGAGSPESKAETEPFEPLSDEGDVLHEHSQ